MPGCRYRLNDRPAVSGSGEVWLATDVILGRQVAVKLLRCGPAGDAGKLARFRAGAWHAGALSHENAARWTPARVMDIAQAAAGLAAAHRAGLVHRDVTPDSCCWLPATW
jgi:eukaryotic-like serine/threonine-protein kinase